MGGGGVGEPGERGNYISTDGLNLINTDSIIKSIINFLDRQQSRLLIIKVSKCLLFSFHNQRFSHFRRRGTDIALAKNLLSSTAAA